MYKPGIIKNQLIKKFKDKTAIIGIIGLGYVGLPLTLRFVEEGYKVLGFDIDPLKIEKLKNGLSYIRHIESSKIGSMIETRLFDGTIDFLRTDEPDVLIVCVPTPLNKHREPDLSFVINTVKTMSKKIRKGQIVSLESTTYPGTTEEVLKPNIEAMGLVVGEDIFLVYSPEREDPGNSNYVTKGIPKICGGVTQSCLEVGVNLYSCVVDTVVPVSSAKVAEMTKLLENIYRAVNIGLVNELKIVADRMGIDIYEVINAAATKPFGFTPFYPGPGLGGHCIPIDPFYLTWKAREYGLHTRFIELAGEINTTMPQWVLGKVTDALNDRGKALKGSKILILGISYKKNVDDMRESPAVELMELLREKGVLISYSDPYVPAFPSMRKYAFSLRSITLTPEIVRTFDCVLLVTNHDNFDYEIIRENALLIVDTRGVYNHNEINVVRA